MARKRDRAFALVMAILFLITSVGLSVVVVWQVVTEHNQNKVDETSQAKMPPKNQLQGTKLANFTPVSHVAKLQAIDTKAGSGPAVQPGAKITVDYTGAVAASGVIFQSSLDSGQPATFSLSGVIPGWSQGIPGMKVGGARRLLIPSALAYGAQPPPGSNIPPNADLVFDITLLKIDK